MLSVVDSSELQAHYLLENLTWRHLDRPTPLFSYVQDPVYNLTAIEVILLDRLHREGLNFTLRPRYDPSSFIHMSVTLGHAVQAVRLEVYPEQAITCVFITERNNFANDLKGWLDRRLGSEHFAANHYVATRHFVHYPYVLPFAFHGEEEIFLSLEDQQQRIRKSTLFFNFTIKERHFLDLFEHGVQAYSQDSEDPVYIQIYPRQSNTGSLEIVISNKRQRQPARVFISGYHPVAYQVITENTELGLSLQHCLDNALGAEHFDTESSRLRGKYLSLIYNVRYSLDVLDSFEEEDDE